jgi:hypothetical protein
VLFHHCSASRIFIMQPGCSPPPVVIQKDDYQPHGGEKQAGLRPPSCPQLQGCSSSLLGWEASRVGVLPSAWSGDLLLPPAFGGEGVHRPCKGGELRLHGAGWLQALSATVFLASWLRWPWSSFRRCLLPLGRGVAVRPPHGRRSRRGRVRHIHGFSRATGRTGGPYKTSYAAGVAAAFLDGLSSLRGRTGVRTSSRAPRQPSSTGAEVAAVVGAEVVAAAGEAALAEVVASAAGTIRATCC